ncbi:MAG: DNA translocase FtsK [Bacillota bacterium]
MSQGQSDNTRGRNGAGSATGTNGRNGNGPTSNGRGSNGRNGRSRSNHQGGDVRWPWVILCLVGMLFIIATGMSRTPMGEGLLVTIPAVMARAIRTAAGIFSMFLCFMVILNSVIKMVSPDEPLPRFVWGLWVLFASVAAMYHAYLVPWPEVFATARDGGGAGMIGASVYWFLGTAVTKYPAIAVMLLGVAIGVSLLLGKSPWMPFSLIWMAVLSGWQWFRDLLGEVFRPHGPRPEDIEVEDDEPPQDEDEYEEVPADEPLDRGPRAASASGRSFSTTVSELREKLSRQDAESMGQAAATASPASAIPGAAPSASGASPSMAGQKPGPVGDLDTLAAEFAPLMEQPPLTEDLFYELPPYDILQKSDPPKRTARSKVDADMLSRTIERTLLSFGVVSKVVNVEHGPTVTRFELQPGPGVKVASIVNLSQDLALALAAQDVRIEAPIPGKSAVGIEVPNKEVSAVHLRDVMESREFRSSRSPLTVAFGSDVSGKPVVTTLDHCLHLLIAGATGSGKSVCINSIIASILYKARPDEVKLVLIDPKRVELTVWGQVPHLIAPVVSDPKKAAGALRWAIKEMEARYEKFTKVGTRDIDRYNEVATPPGSLKPAMPYIVIVIDELSDLMMVAPAEVEDAIFRLAQMARASGIYLVVATQRPSVDVLTGTIKANIPTRVAFAVASQIDSRTILDMAGAEKLLGRGDMLFSPVGSIKPLRAQGCYISEREIDELVSFVSAQAKPQFAAGILATAETTEGRDTEVQDDPFFSQALRIVVEAKQASVSLLQRKLPIGYSRAARLIDAMEVKGYVGPYEGSKPREVRMSIEEYMRMFEGGTAASGQPEAGPDRDSTAHVPGSGIGARPSGGGTHLTSYSAGGATQSGGSAAPAGNTADSSGFIRPPGAAGSAHIDQSILRKPSFLEKPGTMSRGSIRRETGGPRRGSE